MIIPWNFFEASQAVFLCQVSLKFFCQLISSSICLIYLEVMRSVILSWHILCFYVENERSVHQDRRSINLYFESVKTDEAIDKCLMLVLHINSIFIISNFCTVWKFITDITIISMISFTFNIIKVETFEGCCKSVNFVSTAMRIDFVCFTKLSYILVFSPTFLAKK